MNVFRPGFVLFDGLPCLEFFDGENAQMHRETHNDVDDVRWGIRVLPNDLDLLALLCAIKEHFRCLSGGEWTSEQCIVVE